MTPRLHDAIVNLNAAIRRLQDAPLRDPALVNILLTAFLAVHKALDEIARHGLEDTTGKR